ncbi:MAG: hypothetical protein U0Q22_06540 [Acidimicrobiales bacterium]
MSPTPRSPSGRPNSSRPAASRPNSQRPKGTPFPKGARATRSTAEDAVERSRGVRSDGTPRRPSPKPAKRVGTKIPPPPAARPPAKAAREADVWIDEGPVRGASAPDAPKRRRPRVPTPDVDPKELSALVGAKRAKTLSVRLSDAAVAFASERYPEARRILRAIVEEAPGSVTARELLGLTQYRLGNWNDAAKHLEAFRELSGYSVEQHPVLADCYRALKRYQLADDLWAELREASPSAELMVEGRIVAAGSLADRGRLADAVRELEKGWKPPKAPKVHHLRRAYALADLYERIGELPRARVLFGWVAAQEPDFADAAERASSIR